jgi:hypothetical protein
MRNYLSACFLLLIGITACAQDSSVLRIKMPNYFFDCDFCDQAFYRQEIDYVNFVRDRHLADVYSLLTVNTIGTGGNEYKLFLIGQNRFKNKNDTMTFQSLPNAAESDIREGILDIMKKGLLKYLVLTELINQIKFEVVKNNNEFKADKVKDNWNFWTITLSANLNGAGNSYQNNLNMNYNLNANRTTEKLRTETGGWYSLNKQRFEINDSTTVRGFQSTLGGYHFMAFSVGKHLAFGQYSTYFQSTQQNLRHSISYYPALEYNLFDYKEASRRQLRFIYRAGLRFQEYFETTIYSRLNEWYYLHSFVVQWMQIEKWGSVNLSAGSWHYFNYSKNFNASIFPSINFNPLKGLRVGIWGGFSIVNDQFFIRRSDATPNEILLNQIQLKTDYSFNYGFNIGYTFGSKYNNVINVRFDLNDNYW